MSGAVSLTMAAPAAPVAGQSSKVQDALKSQVQENLKKMGELEPWQKTIYADEVVPQYNRFIRDYRQAASGVVADIDQEALKKYLAFYAPRTLKQGNEKSGAKIVAVVKPEASCVKCIGSAPVIRKLVKARLERRGFAPIFVSDEELGEQKGSFPDLQQRAATLAEQKGALGTLVVFWQVPPSDSIDSAHADEEHYRILSSIQVREAAGAAGSGKAAREFKHQGLMELMANDPFDTAAARLLTDAFTELGAKALAADAPTAVAEDSEGPELSIQLAGFKDFAQYTRAKAALEAKLQDAGLLEERRIARGLVVFGIRTRKSADELKPKLAGLSLDPGKLAVVEADEHSIKLEIR